MSEIPPPAHVKDATIELICKTIASKVNADITLSKRNHQNLQISIQPKDWPDLSIPFQFRLKSRLSKRKKVVSAEVNFQNQLDGTLAALFRSVLKSQPEI